MSDRSRSRLGRVLCAFGLHRHVRRVQPGTSGNGTYFECVRCGHDATPGRPENTWGMVPDDR
ncbi:hypothetical protein [Aquipuribacter sp. SD81]|uniref:hypothetical protein n=1 Tax=Aquipuribacter sp. SD81 TaxID=3127703 RepID=UPI003015AB96